MNDDEVKRLAHADYWDERYSAAESETPTHEWFRTFDQLLPFLEPRLFQLRPASTSPRILHLGSGDSVYNSHNEKKM